MIRPGEVVLYLTWEQGDLEFVLGLPKGRKKGDTKTNSIVIQVSALSARKKEPWKDGPMSEPEKNVFFENHDVSDK